MFLIYGLIHPGRRWFRHPPLRRYISGCLALVGHRSQFVASTNSLSFGYQNHYLFVDDHQSWWWIINNIEERFNNDTFDDNNAIHWLMVNIWCCQPSLYSHIKNCTCLDASTGTIDGNRLAKKQNCWWLVWCIWCRLLVSTRTGSYLWHLSGYQMANAA